ncbi:23S rRNA (adenine(1618)-N(6))-methyltransferase RlmF [Spongorhabdus nitratireducens]
MSSSRYRSTQKKTKSAEGRLHPRSRHHKPYDFELLVVCCPDLKRYLKKNPAGQITIDFANPTAVRLLNKALLADSYGIKFWDIPEHFLCPPIPGRADSIHTIADLLAGSNGGRIPKGKSICGLDIGCGASLIYPLLGNALYGWRFAASDIDRKSLGIAEQIIQANKLSRSIHCRFQPDSKHIFTGIVTPDDRFDFTVCNPPFHRSAEEALAGSQRKSRNLQRSRQSGKNKPTTSSRTPVLNFGGRSNELWCEGGEAAFVRKMIEQSVPFAKQCLWFTSLVAKKENLPAIYKALKKAKAVQVETLSMGQGQKTSRMVCWTFHNTEEQQQWFN